MVAAFLISLHLTFFLLPLCPQLNVRQQLRCTRAWEKTYMHRKSRPSFTFRLKSFTGGRGCPQAAQPPSQQVHRAAAAYSETLPDPEGRPRKGSPCPPGKHLKEPRISHFIRSASRTAGEATRRAHGEPGGSRGRRSGLGARTRGGAAGAPREVPALSPASVRSPRVTMSPSPPPFTVPGGAVRGGGPSPPARPYRPG